MRDKPVKEEVIDFYSFLSSNLGLSIFEFSVCISVDFALYLCRFRFVFVRSHLCVIEMF